MKILQVNRLDGKTSSTFDSFVPAESDVGTPADTTAGARLDAVLEAKNISITEGALHLQLQIFPIKFSLCWITTINFIMSSIIRVLCSTISPGIWLSFPLG
jgi:hypothetical protein